jgi:hypothetical protein
MTGFRQVQRDVKHKELAREALSRKYRSAVHLISYGVCVVVVVVGGCKGRGLGQCKMPRVIGMCFVTQ